MKEPSETPETCGLVDEALEEFRGAWIEGRRLDPEGFCREHGECGPELRERIDAFLYVARGLESLSPEKEPPSQSLREEMPEPGSRTLGDFRILREVGRGGMGVVYEAEQISLGRRVALKVLPAHLTLHPRAIERFRREASTASRLRHRGIVEIYSVGEAEGAFFFSMAYIEGTPLDAAIDRIRRESPRSLDGSWLGDGSQVPPAPKSRLPSMSGSEGRESHEASLPASAWSRGYFESACRILVQVADALDHAHSSGVIHRDVKPSNIIVREDGTAVLTDFGLAREEGLPSITVTGDFAGTPYYVSPEQAASGAAKVDHRSDIYSLGATLYELLTLRPPFEGDTSHRVLSRILEREPLAPRQVNRAVPRDLETICLKAMQKKPDLRYQGAAEVAEDLRRFLEYRPIQARPIGPLRRAGRWIRREPAIAAAVFVPLLVLLAASFIYTYSQAKALRNINRAHRRSSALYLAKQANTEIASNPALGMLLAIEARNRWKESEPEIDRILYDAFAASLRPGREVKTLLGHSAAVPVAAFSPDEQLLVTGSYDKTARIWKTDTWESLFELPHEGAVICVCFNPDGSRLATASSDGVVRIWDTQTGNPTGGPLPGYCGNIEHALRGSLLSFSPDGSKIAVAGGMDCAARVFDVQNGRGIHSLSGPAGHEGAVLSVAYSPGGEFLVTTGADERAILWDAASGRPVSTTAKSFGTAFYRALFVDSESVMTVANDKFVTIWTVPELEWVRNLEGGHEQAIEFATIGPRARLAATVSRDIPKTCVWDLSKGQIVMGVGGSGRIGATADFSPDGRFLFAIGTDARTVSVFDLHAPEGQRKVATLAGHDGRVLSVLHSPDGGSIVTTSDDGTARVWDAVVSVDEDLQIRAPVPVQRHVILSPDCTRMLSVSEDGTPVIWDLNTRDVLARLLGLEREIYRAQFSHDGELVAITTKGDSNMSVWSVRGGTPLYSIPFEDHEAGAASIKDGSFSSDGRFLVTPFGDSTAGVWDLGSRTMLRRLPSHGRSASFVSFSPVGGQFAVVSDSCTVHVWDVNAKEPVSKLIGHSETVFCPAWSQDGAKIVTPSLDGTARVWNVADGSLAAPVLVHGTDVLCADFDPAARHVVTGCSDHSIRIWDAATGVPVATVSGHKSEVILIRFLPPDGEWILSVAADGEIRRWPFDPLDRARSRVPRSLTDQERKKYGLLSDAEQEEMEARRRIRAEAERIVNLRFDEYLLVGKVRKSLEDDASLDPEIKSTALDIVSLRWDDANALMNEAFAVLNYSDLPLESYRKPLAKLGAAYELFPKIYCYRYAEQLARFTQAHLQQGNVQEAHEYLSRLEQVLGATPAERSAGLRDQYRSFKEHLAEQDQSARNGDGRWE